MNTFNFKKRYEGTLKALIVRNEYLREAEVFSLSDIGNKNSVVRVDKENQLCVQFVIPENRQKPTGFYEVEFSEEENDYFENRIRVRVVIGNYRTEDEAYDELGDAKAWAAINEKVCGFCEWDIDVVYDNHSEKIGQEIVEELLEKKEVEENYFAGERLKYFINCLSQEKYELLFDYYNEGTLFNHALERGVKASEYYKIEREKMLVIWAEEENMTEQELENHTGLRNNLNMTMLRQTLDDCIFD